MSRLQGARLIRDILIWAGVCYAGIAYGVRGSYHCPQHIAFAQMSDEEVVTLAQQGNALAADEIAIRYQPLVFRRSFWYLENYGDDLVGPAQEGLAEAIREWNRDESPLFSGKAVSCVRRSISHYLRRERSKQYFVLRDSDLRSTESRTRDPGVVAQQPSNGPAPDECLEGEDRREIIQRLMAGLSDEEKAVVTLLYGLNSDRTSLSAEETGRRLQIPTTDVLRLKQRALVRLRADAGLMAERIDGETDVATEQSRDRFERAAIQNGDSKTIVDIDFTNIPAWVKDSNFETRKLLLREIEQGMSAQQKRPLQVFVSNLSRPWSEPIKDRILFPLRKAVREAIASDMRKYALLIAPTER